MAKKIVGITENKISIKIYLSLEKQDELLCTDSEDSDRFPKSELSLFKLNSSIL